jgi:ribosomal protein L29
MAKKRKKDWSKTTLKELIKASDDQERELANLGLKHSQGKLRDTAQLTRQRQELARINTFINQKIGEWEQDG